MQDFCPKMKVSGICLGRQETGHREIFRVKIIFRLCIRGCQFFLQSVKTVCNKSLQATLFSIRYLCTSKVSRKDWSLPLTTVYETHAGMAGTTGRLSLK
jgi:hypothetical protein